MSLYVNRFRRFENSYSYGYDFLIPDLTVWDNGVKQFINMLISEGSTRPVSFSAPITNDYGNTFTSIGTITPDTQGKYDRDGRLNYCVDLVLYNKTLQPPFMIDIPTSMSYISYYLDQAENGGASTYDPAALLAKKLSRPTLLKLHDDAAFSECCLQVIAEYYSIKNQKLIIILDDENYDENASAVCRAVYENAPMIKKVRYISYAKDINRLHNNGIFNLFCCPASEKRNIPQDDSILIIDLTDGRLSQIYGHDTIKNLIKHGLMGDFNVFLMDRLDDYVVQNLLKQGDAQAVDAIAYLYINYRGLSQIKPDETTQHNILSSINELLKGE